MTQVDHSKSGSGIMYVNCDELCSKVNLDSTIGLVRPLQMWIQSPAVSDELGENVDRIDPHYTCARYCLKLWRILREVALQLDPDFWSREGLTSIPLKVDLGSCT